MEKHIQFGNATISYHVHGTGQPVMLVHGFGEKGTVWDQQVAALRQDYMVIVPDLPGVGQSGALPDFSMETMAEVLKVILDKEVHDDSKTVLLGHSMGGYITLAFVEKYSAELAGYGLIHSSCFADTDEKKETRKKGISFIQAHGAKAFLENTSPNLFSPDTKQTMPGLINDFIRQVSDLQDNTLIGFYEAMMARPDRSSVLTDNQLPVLFVLGKHDTAIPIKDGLRQTTFPELSYIHVLEHSGHMGMLEQTEKLNSILVSFLRNT